ncbi:hypothetical protein [Luteipulveratus mongoliensis]|nr:hypothetical protein [Luteipulveratus mongoliensis]
MAERALPGFPDNLNRLLSLVCWIEDRSRGPQLVYFSLTGLAEAATEAGCPMSAKYTAMCANGEIPSPAAVMVGAIADAFSARTTVEVSPLLFFRPDVAARTFDLLEFERSRLADQLRSAGTA